MIKAKPILTLATAFVAGTGRERRQVRLVVFGSLVGFTPILLLLTAQVFGIVLPYDYAFMGLIAMPLSITVSLQSSDLQAAEARLFRILVYLIGALLLLAAHATVPIAHSRTPDLAAEVGQGEGRLAEAGTYLESQLSEIAHAHAKHMPVSPDPDNLNVPRLENAGE